MFVPSGYESYEDDDDDDILDDSGYEIEEYIILNNEDTKNDSTKIKNLDKRDATCNIISPAKVFDITNNIKDINNVSRIVKEVSLNNDAISNINEADSNVAKVNKMVRLQNYPALKISFNRDTFARRIDTSEMSKSSTTYNNEIVDTKSLTKKEEKEKIPYTLEIDRILFDEMKKNSYNDEQDENNFWFTKLIESLNSNESMTVFTNILENCWLLVDNVYSAALYFVEHLGKKIFQVNLVLRSLFDFLQNNTLKMNNIQSFNSGFKQQECFQIIKLKAFVHITKAQVIPNNLHMFDKCFNVSSGDKNIFSQIVRILLNSHQYIKASRCINLANLHDNFTVEEICFPLLFQGHAQELEKHLNGNKKEQEIFISSLDLLFEHPDNLNSKIRQYCVPKIRFELLGNKSLLKLALRLAKLYNINEALLKNISFIQAEKSIRYLVYRKFILKDLLKDEWTSVIQGLTKNNQKLQLFLMDILIDYNEFDEASRFAILLNIPPDVLPSQITLNPNTSNNLIEEDVTIGDCNDDYYKLILPIKNVIWVDTEDLFLQFYSLIQKEGPYVGFDAEWRPNFGGSIKANHISIIQLATCQHVYLLDILTLTNLLDQSFWLKFGNNIFGNPDLFIIGYGCHCDFPNLFQTIPALQQCFNMDIVDLASYHSLMESEVGEKLRGGLNDLAFRCLGKPLDKRQQMSDWNRRPLNDAQILYAAIDAYCLVEIHEKLSLQFSELKTSRAKKRIYFSQSKLERKQINASINITEKPDKRPDEIYSGEKQGYNLLHRSKSGPTPPSSVRVICDVMLAGLGKALRSCGLDVFASTHNLTMRELVEVHIHYCIIK